MSRILLALALGFQLAGCANWSSVYRDFSVDDGTGAMVDIKQRAVIASTHKVTTKKGEEEITTSKVIVCAEPSPDSLSAYAAELSAEASIPDKAALQLAGALQESASFVGLRTQSIQLLRDSMYRLCEGYMSGALDRAQYEILVRRYQKYMVALLGIEQLTGVVRAPTVTINTQGSAEAARSIDSLKEQISAIENKISTLGAENKSLVEEKAKSDTADERKQEIELLIKENKASIDSFAKDKESIQKGIESARGLVAKGSATAQVSNFGVPSPRSDAHVQAVVNSVKEIVLSVVNTDDLGQLCFSYLRDQAEENNKLAIACQQYFDNLNRAIPIQIKAAEARVEEISKKANPSIDELRELERIMKELPRDLGLGLHRVSPPTE